MIFDRSRQVKGVQRQFIGQHLPDRLNHYCVVVPQRQRACAGEAVDETAAFNVLDIDTLGPLERQGDAPWIAAGVRLLPGLSRQQRRLVELIKRFGRRRSDPRRLILHKAGSD